VKVFAYIVIALGFALMALSHPFTDHTKFVAVFSGAAIVIIGMFLRYRSTHRMPILAVTLQDKTQFQKARRELGLRNLLGYVLGRVGAILLLVGIIEPLYHLISGGYDWHVAVMLVPLGVVFILCSMPLLKKSR
jgi:type IV secretory pathway VirB2 component (pilin)